MPANIMDFGAVGDGVADDLPAFQAAIASGAGRIIVPAGRYLLSGLVTLPSGVKLIGDGPLHTKIFGDSLNTAVFHVTGYYSQITGMTIDSTANRIANGNTKCSGILQEPEDAPGKECKFCVYDDLLIQNQPRNGLSLVSGFMAVRITNSRITQNGGHGIWIENGHFTGRTYKSRAGGVHVEDCLITDNAGHWITGGGPNQSQNWLYRINIRNVDAFRNALDASVRRANYGAWLFGENIEVSGCGICAFEGPGNSGPATGGIWVAGRVIRLVNNRYIECDTTAVYVSNVEELQTFDVTIDGMIVSGPALNPAILVDSSVRGLNARAQAMSNITKLTSGSQTRFSSEFGTTVTTDISRNLV